MIQPYRGSGYYKRSGGIHFRVTILAESLRHFSGLAVGGHRSHPERSEGGYLLNAYPGFCNRIGVRNLSYNLLRSLKNIQFCLPS